MRSKVNLYSQAGSTTTKLEDLTKTLVLERSDLRLTTIALLILKVFAVLYDAYRHI